MKVPIPEEAIEKFKITYPGYIISEIRMNNEITLEIAKNHLIDALNFFKNGIQPGYEVLTDLTAVDYLTPKIQTKIMYWLHNPTTLQRIRIIIFTARDEAIPSVISLWPGAKWYERELYDLYGVHFDGHPELKRILMPDDWQGHPLRRDYALTEESVEFKHDVKPKVPSEIIPYVKNYPNT